ncbi:hypothetical protein MMC19_007116 [Ptychographa xylographoides]|nr:hypothetical protein [Ptychographa xylographoides]
MNYSSNSVGLAPKNTARKNDDHSSEFRLDTLARPMNVFLSQPSKDSLQRDSSNSTLSAISVGTSLTDDVEGGKPKKNFASRLPEKRQSRLLRNVRHNVLNVYRRLFLLCVLANLISIVVVVSHHTSIYSLTQAASLVTPISVNILVAALSRTEYVVNLLFTGALFVPKTAPLRLRRILAKIYEYGGVHSGAGLSACLWMIVFTIQMTRAFLLGPSIPTSALALIYLLLGLLVVIAVSAYPTFRRILHNYFEAIHRLAAWTSIALYWALIIVISQAVGNQLGLSLSHVLVVTPSFWILCALTFLVILPWLRLQKVEARPEVLSDHAIRFHFDYIKIGPCQGLRVSTNPLLEWHTFATIPGKTCNDFSILISNAGDWTKSNIHNPASKYWVKGIPVTGFLRTIQLFNKVVIVTTGSGIGPCLSGLRHARQTRSSLQCRLLWSTRDPELTYGQKVLNDVLQADPDAVVINPKSGSPRPDLVALAYQLYVESGAEAVFIISNPTLTYKVKYGMECRGVPAYGPIFDS